ncbi:universal stress protein [Halovenus marina]|uniref:universal stress protein n=1 Tax=Halovenus marina TaxID=3396621 RepID=UPI003F552872
MHYLVATDGSEQSDNAVRYAVTHAQAVDATLELVHVLEPKAELIDGEIVLPGGDSAIDRGEQILERARQLAVDHANEDAVRIETHLLTGRPAHAITDYARDSDVDAIYIGHRGLSEEREQVVGSVAKSAIDRASIPVTVVR